MPVPVDSFAAVAHNTILAADINARFLELYKALDPAQVGIDNSNVVSSLRLIAATEQAWQTIALAGGPTYSPTTLAYFKDSLGMVHLRGDLITLSVANASAGATLCTLPAGYRPVSTQGFTLANLISNAVTPITITSAGVVATVNGLTAGLSYSFGLVHFRAEN